VPCILLIFISLLTFTDVGIFMSSKVGILLALKAGIFMVSKVDILWL
jgi:hypothetical protein